ncbi:MAG: hypothetical protein NUV65_01415 [Candidatus Roizmanbacteria bacterium]|nr:hypothetical protein [Candidatus Roizmanbacteria bacterium]
MTIIDDVENYLRSRYMNGPDPSGVPSGESNIAFSPDLLFTHDKPTLVADAYRQIKKLNFPHMYAYIDAAAKAALALGIGMDIAENLGYADGDSISFPENPVSSMYKVKTIPTVYGIGVLEQNGARARSNTHGDGRIGYVYARSSDYFLLANYPFGRLFNTASMVLGKNDELRDQASWAIFIPSKEDTYSHIFGPKSGDIYGHGFYPAIDEVTNALVSIQPPDTEFDIQMR